MKPCDNCKINIGNYQENKYTLLCGICWIKIATNTVINWHIDKNKYVWIYNSDKLI